MKKLPYLLLFLSLGASAQQNPYVINNPHVIITGDLKVQTQPTRTTGSQQVLVRDSVSGLYKYIRSTDISGGGGGGGVLSFNTRTGAVTLLSADVISALGFTPENVANKANNFSTINSVLYPTTLAVSNYITAQNYTPQTRTITINGTSQDLSANRTYNVGTVTSFSKTDGFGAVSSVTNPTTTPNYTLRIDSAHTANGLMTFKFGASKGHVDSLFASTTINFSNQFKGNGGTLPIRVDSTKVQKAITLTTTGTSGASTFNQGTGALNIPNYAGSFTNPMTTANDIIIGGSGGTPARLAVGPDSSYLYVMPGTHALTYNIPHIYLSAKSFVGGGTSTTDTIRLVNAAIMTKLLTGYSASAGTVAATDNILQAFNKMNGNIALKQAALSGTGDVYSTAGTITYRTYVVNEVPSGTINSINTSFTVAHTPASATFEISYNGVQLRPTTDYTVSGTTVSLTFAPSISSGSGSLLTTYYY